MSTSSENDEPVAVERLALDRISGSAHPIGVALDSTGAAWVSFSRAWMSKIARDGLESARAFVPRSTPRLLCDSADNVLVVCDDYRDAWSRTNAETTVLAMDCDGRPRWETSVATGSIWSVAIDSRDRVLIGATKVFAVTEAGSTVELNYWSTTILVDPVTKLAWRSAGTTMERIDDLAAIASGTRKGPAPSVAHWEPTGRVAACAPCGDVVWVVNVRSAKKLTTTVLRRVRPSEPKGAVGGGVVELTVPFDVEARSMVATIDGGFWAALTNGDLVKYNAAGSLTHRARAADHGWNNAALHSLTVTPDGRTAAALSFTDRALVRVRV